MYIFLIHILHINFWVVHGKSPQKNTRTQRKDKREVYHKLHFYNIDNAWIFYRVARIQRHWSKDSSRSSVNWFFNRLFLSFVFSPFPLTTSSFTECCTVYPSDNAITWIYAAHFASLSSSLRNCIAPHRIAPHRAAIHYQPQSRLLRWNLDATNCRGNRCPCRSRTARRSCRSRRTKVSLPRARFAMHATIKSHPSSLARCSIRSPAKCWSELSPPGIGLSAENTNDHTPRWLCSRNPSNSTVSLRKR